jgi:RHS repeat-associated protein
MHKSQYVLQTVLPCRVGCRLQFLRSNASPAALLVTFARTIVPYALALCLGLFASCCGVHAQTVTPACSATVGAAYAAGATQTVVPITVLIDLGTDPAPGSTVAMCGYSNPTSCAGYAGCLNYFAGSNGVLTNVGFNTWLENENLIFADNLTCCGWTFTFLNAVGEVPLTIIIGCEPGVAGCSQPLPPANPIFGLGAAGSTANPQATAAEPVSTGNGNYYYVHTDLSDFDHIAALPLSFQRSYNSLDSYPGPLGNNWTHSFNIFLSAATVNGSNAVAVKWGDGHNELYGASGNSFVPIAPATSSLSSDSITGNYTLTRKDGVKYFFTSTGELTGIQDVDGRTVAAAYNANGELISLTSNQQQLSLSYDQNFRLAQVVDAAGRSVVYSYDSNGNLISETDPAGAVTQYAYDPNPNHSLVSVTLPNGSVLLQNTYGPYGRVTFQTNADGFTTAFAYSAPFPSQTVITDPFGVQTIHNYNSPTASLSAISSIVDALGHVTSFTYDKNNDVTSITDANGHTSNFSFDPLGNLLSYADPLGNTATFTYNSFSEPVTITTPRGNTTKFRYDTNGNLISVQDPETNNTALVYDGTGDLLSVTDARGNTTSLSYNGCSFCVTAITDPIGNKTSFAYDSIGRPISFTDANNHTAVVTYDVLSRTTSVTDALGNQTLFGYDSVGHLTSITDANKNVTSYTYDPVGNLNLVTDPMGHLTTFAYDKDNNLSTFTNGNKHVTSYSYDVVNRLIKVTSPLKETISYAYDANGNVVTLTDANGKTNTFAYDADNRQTGINYSDGSKVAYTFDADGDRLNIADAHGSTSYAYDALNRILSTAFLGVNMQYGYDAVGNRTSLQYPDGSLIAYVYDQDNRMSQVTDWQSRNSTYAYDAVGNVTKMTYPNSVAEQLAYDPANRLTQIVDQKGAGAFRTLAYSLDAVGNRTNVTDNGLVTKYTYNTLNELKSSTTAKAKTSWDYNAVGNRTDQVTPTGTTAYTYNAAEQMLTAGSTTFTYDKNGNRLTEVSSSSTTTYSYDPANRLLSVVSPSGTSSFTYDGDGNRVTQTIPSGTYSYVNDTNVPLPVVVNENGPDGAIDYGYGLGLLESSSSGFNYFYNFDALGSTSDLTDATGTVQETYSYDAWGNALTDTGSVGTKNKFQFTGQALDPATGLYFMRARYYESTTGRFLSRDTFPGFADQPITLHHYMYAGNNPIRFVDPSGFNGIISGIGFSGDLGLGYGGAGQAQVGTGIFGPGVPTNFGRFVSGGSFVGGPQGGNSSFGNSSATGASVGTFAFLGITNADCAEQLEGPFTVDNYNLGPLGFSIGYGVSDGRPIIAASLSGGASIGFSHSVYTTQTSAQTVAGGGCQNEGAPPTK